MNIDLMGHLYYDLGTNLREKHSDGASMPYPIGPGIFEGALYDAGSYLVEHGKDIYVNNNEEAGRMLVYKYIWNKHTSNIGRALTKAFFLETRRPKGLVKRAEK